MSSRIRVALIYGSTREGRFCDTVADWAGAQIASRSEFALDVIDPAALALPVRHERAANGDLTTLRQRIEQADAFVIVTPEYNHGYPAALKLVIDLTQSGWQAKPVAFVSYGGMSGGLRAVEQLRLVFAELHAVTMRDGVSFHLAWDQFDQAGQPRDPAGCGAAASTMLDRLAWWALALREARTRRPYGRKAVAA
jgi:NAD(P)H-dependent FMN reductase